MAKTALWMDQKLAGQETGGPDPYRCERTSLGHRSNHCYGILRYDIPNRLRHQINTHAGDFYTAAALALSAPFSTIFSATTTAFNAAPLNS